MQPFFSSPARAVVTLLSITVIGFLIWRAVFYQSDVEKGLIALNEAYRQSRPVEARISSLDHAPFINTRDGEPERVNTLERRRAERLLLDAIHNRAAADSYHAVGKLFLLERNIDKAIEYLERAQKAETSNAQIYADLGAAYLEKSKLELDNSKSNRPASGKALEDLGRSLEYLKHALELNSDLLEALFNRALVHQYQGLNNQAEADWRAYVEDDPNSPWAAEAQQKLKVLEDKKVLKVPTADNPLETFMQAYQARDDEAAWETYRRNHNWRGNAVLRSLVDSFLSDNAHRESTKYLQALTYLGQLEVSKAQDTYTTDLAKVYGSATPQTQALLVQARQDLTKGYDLSSQSKLDDAIESFVKARTTFEKVGNIPEFLATEAAIASAAAVQPDLARGQEILARIIPVCESKQYKWLLAETLSRQAHIESNLNNYSEAISDGNRALQLFQELNDMNSSLGVFIQLASLHLFLNDNEMSFSYLKRALTIAEKERVPPTDIWGIHIATSLTLSAIKLHRAALDYQNEALGIALATRTPIYLSRSYQYIGLTYAGLRQFDSALQNIRLAYDQGKRLATERNGQNMMANALLKIGDVFRASGDPNSALTAYEESSKLYETLGFAHYSYAAHKGKFLSYLDQQNDAMAAHELQIVLNLFDEYRQKILDERQKTFFFDREQDIYDLAIDFSYFRLRDSRRAFEYSEICRARNLRDLMQHGVEVTHRDGALDLRPARDGKLQKVLPLTAAEIEQQVSERVQIIQFAVLEKKLLIWHISRSGIFPGYVEIEATKLSEAVATTLNQIRQRDDTGAAASLKNLYRLLIEPIKDKLDSGKVLCFVPDKVLHYVPFGALISGESGRFLLQDFRLLISPSTTIFIDSTNRASANKLLEHEALLAVGNPTVDREANPQLSNLPAAEREVNEIASNYRSRRRVLIRGQASPRSVLNQLARADVVHFAAHYEVDPRSPLSSKLLLAPEPGERSHAEQSGISSGDIYRLNLKRTRLVILSGCKTAFEHQFGGEGPVGFARSFLVAGVPLVVASLWPVDSEATAELMIEFHRFRKLKHSTTEALMRAQQEIMARGNYRHPYYWAGFVVVGGYADF